MSSPSEVCQAGVVDPGLLPGDTGGKDVPPSPQLPVGESIRWEVRSCEPLLSRHFLAALFPHEIESSTVLRELVGEEWSLKRHFGALATVAGRSLFELCRQLFAMGLILSFVAGVQWLLGAWVDVPLLALILAGALGFCCVHAVLTYPLKESEIARSSKKSTIKLTLYTSLPLLAFAAAHAGGGMFEVNDQPRIPGLMEWLQFYSVSLVDNLMAGIPSRLFHWEAGIEGHTRLGAAFLFWIETTITIAFIAVVTSEVLRAVATSHFFTGTIEDCREWIQSTFGKDPKGYRIYPRSVERPLGQRGNGARLEAFFNFRLPEWAIFEDGSMQHESPESPVEEYKDDMLTLLLLFSFLPDSPYKPEEVMKRQEQRERNRKSKLRRALKYASAPLLLILLLLGALVILVALASPIAFSLWKFGEIELRSAVSYSVGAFLLIVWLLGTLQKRSDSKVFTSLTRLHNFARFGGPQPDFSEFDAIWKRYRQPVVRRLVGRFLPLPDRVWNFLSGRKGGWDVGPTFSPHLPGGHGSMGVIFTPEWKTAWLFHGLPLVSQVDLKAIYFDRQLRFLHVEGNDGRLEILDTFEIEPALEDAFRKCNKIVAILTESGSGQSATYHFNEAPFAFRLCKEKERASSHRSRCGV